MKNFVVGHKAHPNLIGEVVNTMAQPMLHPLPDNPNNVRWISLAHVVWYESDELGNLTPLETEECPALETCDLLHIIDRDADSFFDTSEDSDDDDDDSLPLDKSDESNAAQEKEFS